MYKIPRSDGSYSKGVIVCAFKGGNYQTMFYDDNDKKIRLKTLSKDTIYNIIDMYNLDLKKKTEINRTIMSEFAINKVRLSLITDEDDLNLLLEFYNSFGSDKLNSILEYANKNSRKTASTIIEGYNIVSEITK